MKLKSVLLVAVFALIPCAFFTLADEGDKAIISPSLQNGDVNGSGGAPDITDVVVLVNHLFAGGPPPVTAYCEVPATGTSAARSVDTLVANGDIDKSGRIDITDVVRLVNWLYSGGPAPAHLGCNWLDLD